MSPLASPTSDGCDRRHLLSDELESPDLWASDSHSNNTDDADARPQPRSSQRPDPADRSRMTPASTYEILHRIGQTFSHVQYAVYGTAAMLAYGNTAHLCTHVSIVCPAYAQEVIKSWAAATSGMLTYPGISNTIGVTDMDGEVWTVEITPITCDGTFETLSAVSFCFGRDGTPTRVLTMPALVNQVAVAYLRDGCVFEDSDRLDASAGDLVWLLEQICKDGRPEQRLSAERVPAVREPLFWFDFTAAHPGLAGLFRDAGLRVDDVEGVHQTEAATSAEPSRSVPQRDNPGSRGHSRSPTGSDARYHQRLREGPNLTRAETRKVIANRYSRRRSSGRRSYYSSRKSPGRRDSNDSCTMSSALPLGSKKISDFVFGKLRKRLR
ncbi:hypothetical protein CH063_07152 [Colletotrichum higginsianum]|uniref:Uncharacterized protein n=1 Tax=Colletotrichum higginsianum (strain IMI 349063) TaxID=759273 RepID=H1V542_COLHI|nr:hypothetical protein CH63R_05506 [Colletotrichum higginsianum IMI 349063]OBR09814.1 hypothetical protein CH63R_05506 [Colletotrichum higginsianum IMI 349063]CCF35344.1 hypothetical protein CH063_07152 [Colletotrichum higginsianum]